MAILEPVSVLMVAHYRANANEYSEIADALQIPRFEQDLIRYLSKVLGSDQNAQLFEAVARISDYGNAADHADRRKRVSNLLRKKGVSLSRGKRTNAALENMVNSLVPILIYMGLPSASSERSKLVSVLRSVAETFKVPGDARDTLRKKIKIERRFLKQSHELAHELLLSVKQRVFGDKPN